MQKWEVQMRLLRNLRSARVQSLVRLSLMFVDHVCRWNFVDAVKRRLQSAEDTCSREKECIFLCRSWCSLLYKEGLAHAQHLGPSEIHNRNYISDSVFTVHMLVSEGSPSAHKLAAWSLPPSDDRSLRCTQIRSSIAKRN